MLKQRMDGVPHAPQFEHYLRPQGDIYVVRDALEEPVSIESQRIIVGRFRDAAHRAIRYFHGLGFPYVRLESFSLYAYHQRLGDFELLLGSGDVGTKPEMGLVEHTERDGKPYFLAGIRFAPQDGSPIPGPLEAYLGKKLPGDGWGMSVHWPKLERSDAYDVPFPGAR